MPVAEWHGDEISARVHAGAARGLALSAEHLLGVAMPLVPKEESTLVRSGVASSDPEELTSAVSYSTPYAARQHEELTWRHAEGEQAKYLEEPWLAEGETYMALIGAEIRKELEA